MFSTCSPRVRAASVSPKSERNRSWVLCHQRRFHLVVRVREPDRRRVCPARDPPPAWPVPGRAWQARTASRPSSSCRVARRILEQGKSGPLSQHAANSACTSGVLDAHAEPRPHARRGGATPKPDLSITFTQGRRVSRSASSSFRMWSTIKCSRRFPFSWSKKPWLMIAVQVNVVIAMVY